MIHRQEHRNRRRSRRNRVVPNITPGMSPKVTPDTMTEAHDKLLPASSTHAFDGLLEEIQLVIGSFLDVQDLQALSTVNRKYRALLESERAFAAIWKRLFQQRWPAMAPVVYSSELKDSWRLPTAVTDSLGSSRRPNIPLLLRLGANSSPATYDQSLLDHPDFDRSTAASVDGDLDESIRYTGTLGKSPYFTVRSDRPLPRPTKRTTKRRSLPFRLFSRKPQPTEDLQPFVSPYQRQDGAWEVTPRLFAYYEVTILPNPDIDEDDENDYKDVPPGPFAKKPECVAVGLATKSFRCDRGLPGWDSQSFAYHGDDGGLYHARGHKNGHGPTFGIGDTVGCGIDYATGGIFLTRNGNFLGTAWKKVDAEYLENELYPVVGLDTNAPVRLNFGGEKPFLYDLSSFHKENGELLRGRYQWSRRITKK